MHKRGKRKRLNFRCFHPRPLFCLIISQKQLYWTLWIRSGPQKVSTISWGTPQLQKVLGAFFITAEKSFAALQSVYIYSLFSCSAQRACSQTLSHNDGKPWCVWDTQKPSVSSHYISHGAKNNKHGTECFWTKFETKFNTGSPASSNTHTLASFAVLSLKVLSSPN